MTVSNSSANKILRFIHAKKDAFWSHERERRPLALFHDAARRVPAYKDFLRKNRVNPEKIKTWKDFQNVPPISKEIYLKEYPLEKLCWDGTLQKPLVWTSTSGSTGEPFYFPRGEQLSWEYSILADFFLNNSSYSLQEPTLVIIGFGMGVWIGGLFTYQAFEIASQRARCGISIIAPGINKAEIFNALKNLAPHFGQVILTGYPPFVKDIIDEAPGNGINLKKLNLRLLFAAEAFTEKFRDYLVRKGGVENLYQDTLNIYGTADIGAMAWETPTSILMRRLALKDRKLFNEFFSNISKTPTLAQYNPFFITFEAAEGEILFTGDNTVPLVRYAVGDHGGTASFGEMMEKFKIYGINFRKEVAAAKIAKGWNELPFVYVYERNDFAVKLHLRDVYPETVREVLIRKPFNSVLTGKFTIATKYNASHNQYLEVNLESREGKRVQKGMERLLNKKILDALYLHTTGPGDPLAFIKRPNLLKLVFWPQGHELHFKPGIKQKWVKK